MKPARRVSVDPVSRDRRHHSYLERQPLLRTSNNCKLLDQSITIEKSTSEYIVNPPPIKEPISVSDSSEASANVVTKLTSQQKWILLCLCLVDFSAFASMSIIAPFFPYEIHLRGQSTFVAGFIFSIYSITVVIFSAILGPLATYIGPRLMLLSGITVAGTANIVFGLLDYFTNDTVFIVLCFVVRIVEAIGAASFNTASLIYVFEVFPDHVGYAFSMTETFTTLGTTLGPAIGGLLYSWAGYGLPFYVLGTFVFLTIPLCAIKVPKMCSAKLSIKSNASYWQLLKIPRIALICVIVLVLAQSISYLDPTLEPFYRSIGLDINFASLAFFMTSATICILLPLFSKLVERIENEFLLMFFGLAINGLGLLLLGPADFLHLKPSLGLSLFALVIAAIGYALAFIPTFENVLSISIEHGMEDNLATYGTVSGLWSTMFALGEATGPTLGGTLTDLLSFSMASSFMALFSILMAIAAGIAMIRRISRVK